METARCVLSEQEILIATLGRPGVAVRMTQNQERWEVSIIVRGGPEVQPPATGVGS